MTDPLYILGISNFANYEPAAALLKVAGGAIEHVAIAEERLSRRKHGYEFPLRSVAYCLDAFGLKGLAEVDFVYADKVRAARWINSGPGYRKLDYDYVKLKLDLPRDKVRLVDHHDAHAASAFYPSPFEEAAVLVVDGLGTGLYTQALYHFTRDGWRVIGRGDRWGIGRLYSLVTKAVLPYGPEKGYGKVMGLAPYGAAHPGPVLDFQPIDEGIHTDYSAFFTRAPISRLVAEGVRQCTDREAVMEPYFARAAYDVQLECERQFLRMARFAREQTGCKAICIAGGVALNGRANSRILEEGIFQEMWAQPAASDMGVPLGAAILGAMEHRPRSRMSMNNAYTARPYPKDGIVDLLDRHGVVWSQSSPEEAAELVAQGRIIAWFEGASEFGPRALGHRSIVADPRDMAVKDRLNSTVKFREGYRPYAPSILEEKAHDWLELVGDSPFMLQVVRVKQDKRGQVPGITHVDGTTRPQTVSARESPNWHRLIARFDAITGVPLVLNTSFNINREPICETPIDALVCSLGTSIDFLFLEGLKIDCTAHHGAGTIEGLKRERAGQVEKSWIAARKRLMRDDDAAERETYLAAENRIADWHRDYRAKFLIEEAAERWRSAGSRVLVVGTRAHTACLWSYIAEFPQVGFAGFVAMDRLRGEQGTFDRIPEIAIGAVDWSKVDAVLVSTHEHQPEALGLLQDAPAGMEIVAPYDAAGDSLMYVLPGAWPVMNPVEAEGLRTGAAVARSGSNIDFDFAPDNETTIDDRYAFVVAYNGIAADALDAQLRVLRQTYSPVTPAELLDPDADLPESVGLLTFDGGSKRFLSDILPVLRDHRVKATLFIATEPLKDRQVLLEDKLGLLIDRLGAVAVVDHLIGQGAASELRRAALSQLACGAMMTMLLEEASYDEIARAVRPLFDRHVRDEAALAGELYLDADELDVCHAAGVAIGVQGHRGRVLARLSDTVQRQELVTAAEVVARWTASGPALAYPGGRAGDWTGTTKRLLKELGYGCALSRVSGIVKPKDIAQRWELRRFASENVFREDGSFNADLLGAIATAD